MPKPRKLNPVSPMIAVPTFSVVSMISSDATLGRMCRTMIRQLGTPMYRAATTNSRSRRLIVMPRTMRELIIQPNTENSTISQKTRSDEPSRGVTIAITMKLGTTSSRSTSHIRRRSRQPPKYPAIEPTVAASMVEMRATQTPISIDFCMPRSVSARQILAERVGAEPVVGARRLLQRVVVQIGVAVRQQRRQRVAADEEHARAAPATRRRACCAGTCATPGCVARRTRRRADRTWPSSRFRW